MADDIDLILASLTSAESIKAKQSAAENSLRNLTQDEIKYLRRRSKLDLFFLLTVVLRYNKFDVDFHGKLFAWLTRNARSRFKSVLLPRSFLKSTGLTIGHSIQVALPNDPGIDFWPERLGPDARILLAHENHELGAARFLVSITEHFLANDILMGLFPEIVPDPKKMRVNRFELQLGSRLGVYSEPTFDTMGVGGRSQGRHYNYLKLDDLIGDKARDSTTEMQKAKDWFDNVTSFFSELNDDKLDLIGTRWAYDDLYSHAYSIYGDQMLKYIIGAEKIDDKGELVPTCDRLLSKTQIAILKKNWKVWSANYANDPSSSVTEFDRSWKRFYAWHNPKTLSYKNGEFEYKVDLADLDIVILIDPAMGGKAGFIVTGSDRPDRIFILEAVKAEWKPPELVNHLFNSVVRWKPRLVVIEEVNFSGLFQNWLPLEMEKRGTYFQVQPHKVGIKQKEARVRQLTNYFAAGYIHFHSTQTDLITEYDRFGATEDYHILDALSQGPSHWSRPFNAKTFDRYRKIESDLMSEIDPVTGYSRY